MNVKRFSVDPRGLWTRPQVQAVLEIVGPEAEALGLFFAVRETPLFDSQTRWYEIIAYCSRHRVVVEPDSACRECVRRR